MQSIKTSGLRLIVPAAIIAILTVLAGTGTNALAATPQIQTIADQQVSGGNYSYSPSLTAGQNVLWTKAYGPDDVNVNPVTGELSWNISSSMPSESFHLGLRASNDDGSDIETWILSVGSGNITYIGPNEDIKTLKAGMAQMISGDTLIMRNGTWTSEGGDNTIPGNAAKTQKLPSGDASKYTNLMAEDPGQVILDGEGTSSLIQIFGSTKHPDWPLDNNNFTGMTNYLAIKGLVLINSQVEGLRVSYSTHVKLINIGVGSAAAISASSYANLYVYRSSHILIEGLYAWGHGRYKVQFKNASESVVRRSVVRLDDSRIDDPIGGFISYCSKNIVFQNNIVIDSDSSEFWFEYNDMIGAFGVPATNCEAYPEGNVFSDSLVLNSDIPVMNTDARQTEEVTLWQDIVGWDLDPAPHNAGAGSVPPILSGVGATLSNRLTIGEIENGPGYFLYSRNQDSTVTNSLFHRLGWDGDSLTDTDDLIRHTSDDFYFSHNNLTGFLGGNSDGTGNPSIDNTSEISPNLRYITKLPNTSELLSAGDTGGRIGAELLYMRGASGTYYGDDGYDSYMDVPMWPFPGEEQMHTHMNAYRYTGPVKSGGTSTLRGDRGFAVAGQTLTNYVWTYLNEVAPPFRVRTLALDESAVVAWEAPPTAGQDDIQSYKIYRTDTDPIQLIEERSANSRTVYIVDDLTNDETIELGVSAVDLNGDESDIVYDVSVTPQKGTPDQVLEEVSPPDDSGSSNNETSAEEETAGSLSIWELLAFCLLMSLSLIGRLHPKHARNQLAPTRQAPRAG